MNEYKKKLLVLGSGDYSRFLALYLLDDDSKYVIVAFVDDDDDRNSLFNIPIVKYSDVRKLDYDCIAIAVNIQQAHTIIKKAIKHIPNLFDQIIENPIYNDTRVASLILLSEEIERKHLEGSVAELGVYKGDFAKHISNAFPDRDFYLFDTFEGFDERDILVEMAHGYSNAKKEWFGDTNIQTVCSKLKNLIRCKIIKGYFPESINNRNDIDDKFVFVSLDADLYKPMYEGLKYFYPKLVKGGYILIHDYHQGDFQGVKKAVDDFAKSDGFCIVPIFDIGGSAIITK